MSDVEEEQFRAYKEDTRISCRYGAKCYQKNPAHHEKYKHPPKINSKMPIAKKQVDINKKRKNINAKDNDDEGSTNLPVKKIQKISSDTNDTSVNSALPTFDNNNLKNDNAQTEAHQENLEGSADQREEKVKEEIPEETIVISLLKDFNINTENDQLSNSVNDARAVISCLFLTDMPDDFFQFYELCKCISPENPAVAFKDIQLELVGPYDVFSDKFLSSKVKNMESLLRHWRYYYDPPEFQTILKGNDKDGLHYGYWRDDVSEKPVFVAMNKANVNCLIESVAENVVGAVDAYMEEKIKLANPFTKTKIARLHQKLKNYANENNISLEKKSANMKNREKCVVAKTFHKAGIVVPYNKKTQLGYRDLAVPDTELRKLLKKIDEAETTEERKESISKLEEIVRLATIAADECDFGTCLELGHDLFSSGVAQVQNKALQMLCVAYTHLERPQFLQIVRAHLKDRRKTSDLSVLLK